MPKSTTAAEFIDRLKSVASPDVAVQMARYFKTGPGEYGEGDIFIGVKMGQLSALVREFVEMPLDEVGRLLDSPIHEARSGALNIMDRQARRKKTTEERRRELYDLYLRKIDRINNWDLVDVSAPNVIGGYLWDKPRDILYELAKSPNIWGRRTSMLATFYFVKQGRLDDTLALAELFLGEKHDIVQKGVGWMLREAGQRDRARLESFLDKYAAIMPRTTLRYALERFEPDRRSHYMSLKRVTPSTES